MLDRRRQGLLQEGGLSEDERTATVSQLMALVAKLEEEMFQVEARRFDAEVRLLPRPFILRILARLHLLAYSWVCLPSLVRRVQNKAAGLQREVELLRQRIHETEVSTADKRTELAALGERRDREAVEVDAGGQRCLQYATSLRSAEANRALRASLLAEKRELINGLQQELGQVTPCPLLASFADRQTVLRCDLLVIDVLVVDSAGAGAGSPPLLAEARPQSQARVIS